MCCAQTFVFSSFLMLLLSEPYCTAVWRTELRNKLVGAVIFKKKFLPALKFFASQLLKNLITVLAPGSYVAVSSVVWAI